MASSLLLKVPGQNGKSSVCLVFSLFVCFLICARMHGGRIHFDETLKQVLAFGVVSDRI